MHYQSLNAALEQYSGSLTHNPASPNSLALHIDRQTQGRLKLHTPDGISLSLTYQNEPVFWLFFSHDLYRRLPHPQLRRKLAGIPARRRWTSIPSRTVPKAV